jgi:hypothetical protein
MSKEMSPTDKKLYSMADEVLHYIWDPIGVSGVPMARDEYHAYLPHVFSLLKTGSDTEKIADYLFEVSTQKMGLNGKRSHDMHVAGVLLDWKETLDSKHS